MKHILRQFLQVVIYLAVGVGMLFLSARLFGVIKVGLGLTENQSIVVALGIIPAIGSCIVGLLATALRGNLWICRVCISLGFAGAFVSNSLESPVHGEDLLALIPITVMLLLVPFWMAWLGSWIGKRIWRHGNVTV